MIFLYLIFLISLINVLEHIKNPIGLVNDLYDRMHRGAMMVFEVPRHPSVASLANLTHHSIIYRHITPPVHLQIFSDKAINMILEGKFRLLGKWEFGQGFTDLINYAMISSDTHENELYDEVMKASNSIQFAIDKAGLADQILVIAQKV